MEQERSLETTASPESVWRIWSDPARWSEWNPSIKTMEMRGPFAVGTQALMTTDRGRHPVTFVQIDQGRSFTIEGPVAPGATAIFTCTVEPRAAGSRISQRVSMRGPLAGVFFPMVGKLMAGTIPGILKALAERAERG